MKVRICQRVEIDAEVFVGLEDIAAALAEAAAEADRGSLYSVTSFVAAVYKCLAALSDETIECLPEAHALAVVRGLRTQVERIARVAGLTEEIGIYPVLTRAFAESDRRTAAEAASPPMQ